MCGIVGILGRQPVAFNILEALKRLEYRGYDSAGLATLEGGVLQRTRAEGKLKRLETKLVSGAHVGTIGIGHTRWATHGKPTEINAHPQATDVVAVVHNGIIENFRELREALKPDCDFTSETDTEVIAHLVTKQMQRGLTPKAAVEATLLHLQGAFALALLFAGYDDLLIVARKGSPLAIGYGEGEMFVGSDAIALAPFTDQISYLEDGDYALISRAKATIFDSAGREVERAIITSTASVLTVDKGNHRHFMEKEIHEQPEVVEHTLDCYLNYVRNCVTLPFDVNFRDIGRIAIVACGTAYYAGLVARYWFEKYAKLPVDIDVGSEFRYREPILEPTDLTVLVTQSGETADTIASMRYAKGQGQKVVAVVNVATSTIAREADFVLPTLAGPEIGVASTKAFTCQLAALAALVIAAGKARGVLSAKDEERLVSELKAVPAAMLATLKLEPQIKGIARSLTKCTDAIFFGRGTSFPLALEGALKLKEISYIHAEGYAAGELKHGAIALIDESVPVIVIAPSDGMYCEKAMSNVQEAHARGGRIILITDEEGASTIDLEGMVKVILPTTSAFVAPLVEAVAVQLLAYHTAVAMGTDVDQPRNLAKSVTVE